MLCEEELAFAVSEFGKISPGQYTLRELYGAEWRTNPRPGDFGRRFKAAVLRNAMPGIRLLGRRSRRNVEYELLPH